MTELRLDSLTLPTSTLGVENPLAPLFGTGNVGLRTDLSAAPAEIREGAAYGRVSSVAPYFLQDRYGRDPADAQHRVAVLENEKLTATFLLDHGGRLFSLVDRPSGRELLFRNEVLQPGNLALRNAWFAGGVEWNVGTIGHSPGTCSPVHAGRVAHPDGSPVLRIWEFDRIRGTVHQIDFHLPPDSSVLYVLPKITNRQAFDVPTYWWSNIAVAQDESTRVIASADRAWAHGCANRIVSVPILTTDGGADISYPGRSRFAADYFFDTEDASSPWIAALDANGAGLAQTSTAALRGRKLFLWGHSSGGRRWQDWLSGAGQRYAEIQAGLTRTQFEHVRLPARSSLAWVEAYGRIEVDADRAHADWASAREATGQAVRDLVSESRLAAESESGALLSDAPVAEILHLGSGWGALELIERSSHGDHGLVSSATPFEDRTLGAAQSPWLELMNAGRFPHAFPTDFVSSMQISDGWARRLSSARGWLESVQYGNLLAARGDLSGAEQAWLSSLEIVDNVMALRNLGALRQHLGDITGARDWYLRALRSSPSQRSLAIEALDVFGRAGDQSATEAVLASLAPPLRDDPRVRLAEVQQAIRAGDLGTAGAILGRGLEIPDLREGENVLSDTWIEYRTALLARERSEAVTPALRSFIAANVKVPTAFDFRLTAADPEPAVDRA